MAASVVVALLLATFAIGFLARQTSVVTDEYRGLFQGSTADAIAVLQMQVEFKTQVQEWKNTLLRGSNADQREKYAASFHQHETNVQNLAVSIADTTSDPVVREKVTAFEKAHRQMGMSYQKALDSFSASGGEDQAGADAMVKGQDRAPSDLLTELSAHSMEQSRSKFKAQSEQAKTRTMWAMLSVILLAFGAASVFYAVYLLVARVKRGAVSLRSHARTLGESSDALGERSQHAVQQAQGVVVTSESISHEITDVSMSVSQMGIATQEIARSASEADTVARQAAQRASETNEIVARLGDSSGEIGKVIDVITSIAEQTNLLALNATIEAARAGEAGKGFAVVAHEVKELATQTASATDEISRRISAIQTETSDAVRAIDEITSVITKVNDLQSSIAGAVEEQSSVAQEIARSVTDAASGVQEIAASAGVLNEAVAQASTTARYVREESVGVHDVAWEMTAVTRFNDEQRVMQ